MPPMLMMDESTKTNTDFRVNWIPVGFDAGKSASSLEIEYWQSANQTGFIGVDIAQDIERAGMDWLPNGGIGLQLEPGMNDIVDIRHTLTPYNDSLHDLLSGARLNVVVSFLGETFPCGITPSMVQTSINQGAITIAVLSLPYESEGTKHMEQSIHALNQIESIADTTCVIPLDKLSSYLSTFTQISNLKKSVYTVYNRCVRGITDLACYPGFRAPSMGEILEFFKIADDMIFGYAQLEGNEQSMMDAIRYALKNPLCPQRKFDEAEQVLISICLGSPNIDSNFYLKIGNICSNLLGSNVDIIVGSFESQLQIEKPWMVIYGRGTGKAGIDGFDFPESRLDPEKAPPRLPAYYRQHYGQLTEKYY